MPYEKIFERTLTCYIFQQILNVYFQLGLARTLIIHAIVARMQFVTS